MTIPGSVDPEALRIYAQGGKYTPKPVPVPPPPAAAASGAATPDANTQRDAIARTILGSQGFMGGGYVDPDLFRIIPGGA